ncbi:MAG TPA: Nramp family divalent metal transporter [Xanthobacteraceae bacterium]|nr:Nramp family divalent metal transporter [Xanthobacteraceae bacterium]
MDDSPSHPTSDRTIAAARAVLTGEGRGLRSLLPFLGPAVIASVAYMDPGNFATNIEAGAKFGYTLLWVVLVANVVAMLFQALSAKLGIVTGVSLAGQCREHFPAPVVYAMWIASEVAAMATDLAEFLGAAVGLSLLFGLPLMVSLTVVGIATYAMLLVQGQGFRPMEILIGAFVAIVGVSYLIELIIAPPDWRAFAYHAVVPQLQGLHGVTLAVGIIGATVMPHAIYLHSSLTQNRIPASNASDVRRIVRFSNTEVLIALGVAGLVNMAMVAMSAVVFHDGVHNDVASIETAYRTLIPLMGAAAAGVFLVSLLASGFSSSVVGTMAGQVIMQDFVRFRTPLWFRRVITMIPAFVVAALGFDATQSLVLSQVVLSLVLPVPMIALLILTARRDVMGEFANSRLTNVAAITAATVVLFLNAILLLQATGVPLPFVGGG